MLDQRERDPEGKYYKLAIDININSTKWDGYNFYGHLDGQNHTINLNIDNSNNSNEYGISSVTLFDYIEVTGDEPAVKRLNITGNLKATRAAGFAYNLSGIIEDCSFNGTIEATEYATGIFIGETNYTAIVRNCKVKGNISGDHAGGISVFFTRGEIKNCIIETSTTISGYHAGGIVCMLLEDGYIRDCVSNAIINATKYAGGIVGECADYVSIKTYLIGNKWPSQYPQVGNDSTLTPSPVEPDSGDITKDSASLNGHVYRVIHLPLTWDGAKEYCESLGGHLATITSEQEYNVILQMLELNSDDRYYWLGASDSASEGSWQWVTGEKFSYTHWLQYEPTDAQFSSVMTAGETPGYHQDQDYLIMRKSNGVWGWYDVAVQNSAKYSLVCEFEPIEAEFAPLNQEYILWSKDHEAYFQGSEFYGDIPEPVDYSHLDNNLPKTSAFISATLPAKYDPRQSGTLPAVRNQESYGTCWSFASLGALEASYLAQQLGTNAPDLSELHQAWFVFKDPRPGYSFKLYSPSDGVLNQGGNSTMSISFLSRAGAASENDLPYTSANNVEKLTSGKYPENYSHPLRLTTAYSLGELTAAKRDTAKKLIQQYGALTITYHHSFSSMSGTSYYLDTTKGYGHMVDIVGWDDNYTASNFANKGAWLVKNSWGTSFGENGYFWMSYNQKIGDCAAFTASKNISDSKLKGYDALPSGGSMNYHWSANVYKAEGTEYIKEVSFYTRDNNVPYEIYINKLGKERPVNPGVPDKAVLSGTITYAGYHTVTLSNPVNISDGEYFSVILKLGQASQYKYTTAVEDSNVIIAAIVKTGESYFAKDSSVPALSDWKDGKTITDKGSLRPVNACIKILTSSSSSPNDPDKPDDPYVPDVPDNPDDPDEPDTPGTVGGSGGGGGCSSGFGILALTGLALLFKKN